MKRILCLMLALFCILPIVACGNTNPPLDADGTTTATPDDTDSVTTDANGSVFDPEDSDVTTVPTTPTLPGPDDLFKNDPPLDLGGYTYKGYVPMMQNVPYIEDFEVDYLDHFSTAIDYAAYERNKAIEETYNCRIRQCYATTRGMYDEMTRFYFNGEKYELAILFASAAATCATVSLLQNVYTLDNINLSHSAYDQNSIEQLAMGGKLHYLSGDMNISTMDWSAVTVFNSDLFDKYDFVTLCGNGAYDDLYEMVAQGTWTISAMLEMAEVVNVDGNENGVLNPSEESEDVLGYFAYVASPLYYWYGCGARITSVDSDNGYPTLTFGSDEASKDLFDFLFDSLNNKTEGNEWIASGSNLYHHSSLMANRLLFSDNVLWNVRKVLHPQNKARYGILPTPKYNEAQEEYHNVVNWPYTGTFLWSIPRLCRDTEKASFVFQLMAEYSHAQNGTMQAYFEESLCKDMTTDSGALATMRIIRSSVTYDIFLLYNWGNLIFPLIRDLGTADENLYEKTITAEALDVVLADMNLTLERFKHPIEPQIEDAA